MKIFTCPLSILCAMLLSVCLMHAQQEYIWEDYNLGFEVPIDFEIQANNNSEFTASNDYLYLTILPWHDEDIEVSELAQATLEIALELEYDELEDGGEIDIDDFEGYYVVGWKDDVQAAILSLLDPYSETNLIVVIVFEEDYEDEAIELAESLYILD